MDKKHEVLNILERDEPYNVLTHQHPRKDTVGRKAYQTFQEVKANDIKGLKNQQQNVTPPGQNTKKYIQSKSVTVRSPQQCEQEVTPQGQNTNKSTQSTYATEKSPQQCEQDLIQRGQNTNKSIQSTSGTEKSPQQCEQTVIPPGQNTKKYLQPKSFPEKSPQQYPKAVMLPLQKAKKTIQPKSATEKSPQQCQMAINPPAQQTKKTVHPKSVLEKSPQQCEQAVALPAQRTKKTVHSKTITNKSPQQCQKAAFPPAAIPLVPKTKKTLQPKTAPERSPQQCQKAVVPPAQKTKKPPQPKRVTNKSPQQCQKAVIPPGQKSKHKSYQLKLASEESPECSQENVEEETTLEDIEPYLTEYEKREITQYDEVWYIGKDSSKIQGSEDSHLNYGYDSNDGYYKTVIRDHLAYRYEVLKEIGRHSGGTVLKCVDHKTKQKVAIKVIRNRKWSFEEAQWELQMLEHLQTIDPDDTANIVHMKDSFVFRNHVCIIFELLLKNFTKVLYRKPFYKLSMEKTRHYAIDLLKCLLLLSEAGIVHGDLKPENMLLSRNGPIKHAKVIDFGGSFFVASTCSPTTVTYPYAAPEFFLKEPCDTSMDMWSLGCIVSEMYTGYMLFAEKQRKMLKKIMRVLCFSVKELLELYPSQSRHFECEMKPKKGKGMTLSEHLNTQDTEFLDFIKRCLEFDPKQRMTPQEAMQHPWITNTS